MKRDIEAAFRSALLGLETDLQRWLLAIDDPEAILTTLFQHADGYSGLDIHVLDHARTELGERLYAQIWDRLSEEMKTYLERRYSGTLVVDSPQHNVPRNFAISAHGYPLLTFSITGHYYTDERPTVKALQQNVERAIQAHERIKENMRLLENQMERPWNHVHNTKDLTIALFRMKEYHRLAKGKLAALAQAAATAEEDVGEATASLDSFLEMEPAIEKAWQFWRPWFHERGYEERSNFCNTLGQ